MIGPGVLSPEEQSRRFWMMRAQVPARRHAAALAQLAAAFDGLMYRASMSEASDMPAEELTDVPDVSPEELCERDMPPAEALELLSKFFTMTSLGAARLHFILGLQSEPPARATAPLHELLVKTINEYAARHPDTTAQEIVGAISQTIDALNASLGHPREEQGD